MRHVAPSETSAGAAEMGAPKASEAIGYRRIVVPLDGSELAERALPHAEAVAHLTHAPLHLVRVIDPTHLAPLAGVALRRDATALQLLLEDERIAAREYLERIERDLLARQQKVSVEYRHGPAARELLAVTQPGDLVIMSTHGLGGLARWFLGSVAEEVVRRATVPVWLVRVSDTEPTSFAIRRLVVPLDGSALAEDALRPALALAKRLHVPIHLITVIDVSGALALELAVATVNTSRLEETLIRLFAEAEIRLGRACERLRHAGVETSTEVRHGSPGQAIVAAAQPGDLIVMTSHGRTGLPRWFLGSVAEAVIRHASVPVLLVHSTATAPDTSADDASE
jgi:nucleotide-binding universal stress UspA family protein